jgi:hypothetical protein
VSSVTPGGNAFFAPPVMLRRSMIFGGDDLDVFKSAGDRAAGLASVTKRPSPRRSASIALAALVARARRRPTDDAAPAPRIVRQDGPREDAVRRHRELFARGARGRRPRDSPSTTCVVAMHDS